MENLYARSVRKIWRESKMSMVEEIMTPDPVTVKVDTQATKVRSIFREGWLRSIPVLSNNHLEGMITRGDMMFLSSTKSNIEARVLMKRPKVIINSEADVEDAAKKLLKADIVQAPVVESNENMHLVGILSMGDILKKMLNNGANPKNSKISSIVTKNVVKANYDDHITKIWSLMDETGFSGLPVLKKNKLIGMITRKDIIKSGHVRKGLDAADRSIKVEKIMVTPPVVVTEDTSVTTAAELMIQNDIGRLPVVEKPIYIKKEPNRAREANLVGIVAREDILGSYLT